MGSVEMNTEALLAHRYCNPKYCNSCFYEPRSHGGHFECINRVGGPSLSENYMKVKRNASGCGVYKEGDEGTVRRK
jgi:hypothetical protein